MAVIAQEGQFDRFGSVFKSVDTPEDFSFHVDLVPVLEATATTYAIGTVLGKITASGNYIISKQGAADGSQTPVAVVAADGNGVSFQTFAVPASATKVLAVTRGKLVVAKEGLKLDASFSTPPQKAAAYAALATVGILVADSN